MEIAYVAGLFDGEGVARIDRWVKPNSAHIRYQVRVAIGMTHKPVIQLLSKQFGGKTYVNDHSKRNPNHRAQFCWGAASLEACKFLNAVLPFLIVKRDEAILCLELQADIEAYKFKLGNRYWRHADHADIIARRHSLYDRVSALKHIRW